MSGTPLFVLASRSPRREALLRGLGLHFEVHAADVPEQPAPGQTPADYALSTALAKACAVAEARSAGSSAALPVLGADTDVAVDGQILGKPRGREDALAMLDRLSGRAHEVYSAVALVAGDRRETRLSVTRVEFAPIAPAAAAAYWAGGEPADKAGAYAIQGYAARWVRAIHGSYTGVVGLPLCETCELLEAFGIDTAGDTSRESGA